MKLTRGAQRRGGNGVFFWRVGKAVRDASDQGSRCAVSSAAVTLCVLALWSAPASSQDINDLNIDFHTGPIINSGRVVGLGGAYTSVSEGADGHLINPASFAVRYMYDADDDFSYDFSLSSINDFGSDTNELDLSGRASYDEATFDQIGLNMKWLKFGGGIHLFGQSYSIQVPNSDGTVSVYDYSQEFAVLGFAYNFRGGDVVLGMSLTTGTAELSERGAQSLKMVGGGGMFGALWAPASANFRLGGTFRSRTRLFQRNAEDFEGEEVTNVGRLRAPASVIIPWEAALGWSYMFGPRDYNFKPTFGLWIKRGELKPERKGPRRYLLVSADLVVTGPADNGIGVQSFLAQNDLEQSGQHATVSPRAGVESEFWEDVMVARVGTYYEPSRFEPLAGRIHGTAGLDVHISLWLEWKLGITVDVAENYVNTGFGLGFWH